MNGETQRQMAEELINQNNANREKWETWYPHPLSEVEVPRVYLFALQHYAEIGLKAESDRDELIAALLELHDYSRPFLGNFANCSIAARRKANDLLERFGAFDE